MPPHQKEPTMSLRDRAPIVSEVTLYVLTEPHASKKAPGSPVCTVTTYAPGSGADPTFACWTDDGALFDEVPLLGVSDLLSAVKALRRTAQDDPQRFVCLNRTNGDLTLVA